MSDTTTDVLARLDLIQPQIAGLKATLHLPQAKIDPRDLPAFFNKPIGSNHSSPSSDMLVTNRTFLMALLVAKICEGRSPDESLEETNQDSYPFLDFVPEFFFKRPRLEHNNQGLGFVVNKVLLVADDGPQKFMWGGDTFRAILYRLPLEIRKKL